jgi:beta-N-acetylhexosaminidase
VVSWRRLAGQRLMVRMDGKATSHLIRASRNGRIGGVIVFPASGLPSSDVAAGVERLQRAAKAGGFPPLLVATDQEGGLVKRFPDDPPYLSAPEMGQGNSVAVAEGQGRATGRFLSSVGINLDLAPVLDVAGSNSAMASRAFGSDAGSVARLGTAFAKGLERSGVAACVKHFPGLGRAVSNTDFERTVIAGSRASFSSDLAPFQAAFDSGASAVMLSTARYPGLGGSEPAAWNAEISDRLVRQEIGFRGVSLTDDLASEAIRQELDPRRAALRAWSSGVDIALLAHPVPGEGRLTDQLFWRARNGGGSSQREMRRSIRRILALKAQFADHR